MQQQPKPPKKPKKPQVLLPIGPVERFASNSAQLHQQVKADYPHLTDEQVRQMIKSEL